VSINIYPLVDRISPLLPTPENFDEHPLSFRYGDSQPEIAAYVLESLTNVIIEITNFGGAETEKHLNLAVANLAILGHVMKPLEGVEYGEVPKPELLVRRFFERAKGFITPSLCEIENENQSFLDLILCLLDRCLALVVPENNNGRASTTNYLDYLAIKILLIYEVMGCVSRTQE
jgi:hypothetical protein